MSPTLFSMELFKTMTEEAHDMVFLIRIEDGLVTYVNRSAVETLGYSLEELQHIGIHSIRRALEGEEVFGDHLHELSEEAVLTDYALVRRKDGTEIPVEVKAKVIRSEGVDYNLAMVRDISERIESGILYRDFVEGANELVTRVDAEGNILYVNHNAETVFGLKPKACIGRSAFDFVHPDDRERTRSDFQAWKQGSMDHVAYENRQVSEEGRTLHILWNIRIHRRPDGSIEYINSIGGDITDRVTMERELAALNDALEEKVTKRTVALKKNMAFLESYKQAIDANNIVSKSDKEGIITYVNDNFLKVTGYRRDEVIGVKHNVVRHKDTPAEVFDDMWSTIRAKKVWKGVLKNRKKDGSYYWVDIVIVPILDEQGEIFEYIAVRHEITELIDKREELEKIAYFDLLTGLGNRHKLLSDLEHTDAPLIALLDIDKFSATNDFYGHAIGDCLIVELAGALQNAVDGHRYRIYRLHGDEFALLASDGDRNAFIAWIRSLVEHLNTRSITAEGNEIIFDLSAGISCESRSDLLSTADIALKRAKNGQHSVMVYDAEMSISNTYEKNIIWSKKLKEAIRDKRITAYYQPLVNNQTGAWDKYEALMRMIDEEGKVISPFFFLDIAKQSRQYLALTKIIVEESFSMFRDFDASFSVNLSIDDILDPELQTYLVEMIERYGVGEKLIFELVESEGIENFEPVSGFIDAVKALGCRLAIDDFGTGYSNFEYLMRLKADFIKIDGSLIKNMDVDANARSIVTTIVDFAKKTGLKTVAEFVKDEAIQEIVLSLGIDYSQGFYFSEPLPLPPRKHD